MRTYLDEIEDVRDSGIDEIDGKTVVFETDGVSFYLRIKGTKKEVMIYMGENDSSRWYDQHTMRFLPKFESLLGAIYEDEKDGIPKIHVRARGKKRVGGYVKKDRRRAA